MTKDILYPIARDISGTIVHANNPSTMRDHYICLGCGRPMAFYSKFYRFHNGKRSEVSPHFQHIGEKNENCSVEAAIASGESIYHSEFKELLYNKIKRDNMCDGNCPSGFGDKAIKSENRYCDKCSKNNQPFVTEFICECGDTHNSDMIRRAYRIEMEYHIGEFRPDIALIDKYNKVFAVLEIIVAHNPEPNYLNFLKDNNVYLLTFKLDIMKPFQYWIDKYIGDGVLCPSSFSFFYCNMLKLQYAFSLWSYWLEETTLDFECYYKNKTQDNAEQATLDFDTQYDTKQATLVEIQDNNDLGTNLFFPWPRPGKSENIRFIQFNNGDQHFAEIEICGVDNIYNFPMNQNVHNEIIDELRRNNLYTNDLNYLKGSIFSIVSTGKKSYFLKLRIDLMKEELDNAEQEFIRKHLENEKLEKEFARKKEENEKLGQEFTRKKVELEKLRQEFELSNLENGNLSQRVYELKKELEELIKKKEEKAELIARYILQ